MLEKLNHNFWYSLIGLSAVYFSLSTTHTDVLITLAQIPGFLEGHILDFYDHYAAATGRSPGYPPNYMPLMYFILGIWQLPTYLLGFLTEVRAWSIPHIWHKCLNILFLCLIFIEIRGALGRLAGREFGTAVALATILSPIVLYSTLTFGQFDVYPLYFIIFGFFRLCRGQLYTGAFSFGISMGFKYFGLFAFLPLLLFLCKDVRKLVFSVFMFVIPYLALRGIYSFSPGFVESVLNYPLANSTLFAPSFPFGSGKIHVVLFLFALTCAFSWVLSPSKDEERNIRKSACLVFLAFATVFGTINFHPQWMIYPGIFLAFISCMHIDKINYRWLELAVYYFFFAYIVTFFNQNTDNIMFQSGIFSTFHMYEFKQQMSVFFLPSNKDWLYSALSALMFFIAAYTLYLELHSPSKRDSVSNHSHTSMMARSQANLAFIYILFYLPASLSLRHPNPMLHAGFVCLMIILCFILNKQYSKKI